MNGTATATAVIMTGTGSRFENEAENGLAHFLEHMFFKGTKKRPTAQDISRELDTLGSSYNAYTAKDRTAYHAKVASEYLDTALDVLFDLFLNATLAPKEIRKEQGAVIQEIDMYEDMPMRTIDTVFDALLYGNNHPLGRTILGPKENIRAFTRRDFQRYLARNYSVVNTVIAIAGAFSEKKVLGKITRDFGSLPKSPKPLCSMWTGSQDAPRVHIKIKQTDQTQLMLGVSAYPYLHKDEYALAVLTTLLGGGMSSRLFSEVREKRGLAYSIYASIDKYTDTGNFTVQAGVEHEKLPKALSTILSELKKLKHAKVSAEELHRTKSYMKGTLALSLETSDAIAENAATALTTIGRIRPLMERLADIDAVSARDIQRVAQDIFKPERLNLAILGPHAGAENKFLPLLTL